MNKYQKSTLHHSISIQAYIFQGTIENKTKTERENHNQQSKIGKSHSFKALNHQIETSSRKLKTYLLCEVEGKEKELVYETIP